MKICKIKLGLIITMLLLSNLNTSSASSASDTTRQLARDLGVEGQHEAAALEYRRLAIMEEQQETRAASAGSGQAGYYWIAAYEYFKAGKYDLVQKMLDKAEDASTNIITETMLLRAEAAIAMKKLPEADYYLKNIIERRANDADVSEKVLPTKGALNMATRNLAQVYLSEGKPDDAKKVLMNSQTPCPAAAKAVDVFQSGSNRSPRIGGILGLIPGVGYAYSGEYANALRSLILNGLFIYAMTDTADNKQWGAFTAITFFEITWYTGSIYGGIDAAQRFNQTRLDSCINDIRQGSGFQPDFSRLPVISLKFDF